MQMILPMSYCMLGQDWANTGLLLARLQTFAHAPKLPGCVELILMSHVPFITEKKGSVWYLNRQQHLYTKPTYSLQLYVERVF